MSAPSGPSQKRPTERRIGANDLWEIICGADSLLSLFARTQGLIELVQDLAIETVESDRFDALALLDPEDGITPLIRFSTGCYDRMLERLRQAFVLAEGLGLCPWKELGWKRAAFAGSDEFAGHIARVALDFMTVHEVSHVARGHVDRYLKFRPEGMAERGGVEPAGLPALRRLALELDADSLALYHLVTLADLLRNHSVLYRRAPSTAIYMASLGFAVRMLFALLSEGDQRRRRARVESLEGQHRGFTHPLPVVRDEFADQRMLQLALSAAERRVFRRALNRSHALFLTVVDQGLFGGSGLPAWQHEPAEVAAFLNLLIDDIATASKEGWMDAGTRMSRTLNALAGPQADRQD